MSAETSSCGHNNANCTYFLVTGANGGLGLAICRRLITTFITTRSPSRSLHLLITTRSAAKNTSTLSILHAYIVSNSYPHSRITLQACVLDLCSIPSILAICQQLNRTLPRIDVVILNAGLGGFTGINWPVAIYSQLTNFRSALTYPTYKISSRGLLLPPQALPSSSPGSKQEEQRPLGQVFTSNVFGHYFLIHHLLPLLAHSRVLWVSSLEAYASAFNIHDIQALDSLQAYESSKRLTDLLVLTASLPSTSPYTVTFHTPRTPCLPHTTASAQARNGSPTHHLVHPGICSTSFLPLPLILFYLEILFFHIVRLFFNSPWHSISPYKGAIAPVWVALADESELAQDSPEGTGLKMQKSKWGSSTNRWGHESVVKTAVAGSWEEDPSGRLLEASGEGREDFENLGRECWRQMEELRMEWERMLGIA